MKAILVSHSHWDREWYRTFQDFRSRLVDLVDHLLEIEASDPGYRFLLDGQTVVLEDYLEIRPDREEDLGSLCRDGRVSIGPWYVQPDSLLPSGEAHVRNLLIGRRVGEAMGPVSRVGYTPDSFGHPAQFPQLFRGFGIESFIYWRGNGSEIDRLPSEYDWEAPDGSWVVACHLGKGYFSAATAAGVDLEAISVPIAERAKELADRTRSGVILLLNGLDHAPPEVRTERLADEIARATGFVVERGLLDEFVSLVLSANKRRPRHIGELLGAKVAPLLPGVWSARMWIKQENRRTEAVLEGWAEPFAALASRVGLADERPALRLAWKELLKNQAHDSICGCSRDEVHDQMRSRFDTARELAEQTTTRCLERIAGLGVDRAAKRSDEFDLCVFNPSTRTRTDLVRFPLDFHPYLEPSLNPMEAIHPTVLQDLGAMQFTADGRPARLVPAETGRMKLLPERGGFDLEFVARDIPAMGFRRVEIRRVANDADEDAADMSTLDVIDTFDAAALRNTDESRRTIEVDGVRVTLRGDGLFNVRFADREFVALGEIESRGDRGDTYDYDEVQEGPGLRLESVSAERRCHAGGVQELCVNRQMKMPARLADSREERCDKDVPLEVVTLLRVIPGVDRVEIELRVENAAEDHRLRVLFPVPGNVREFEAATTFDVATRTPGPNRDPNWMQPPPATFPHQGFVHANGLSVVAPGLPEAEVIPGETSKIAMTLLRCVGSLSRLDLRSRPGPAGPATDTPVAQCKGSFSARISLLGDLNPARARESEIALRSVLCGREEDTLMAADTAFLEIAPPELLLSAFKPAESGQGVVIRVLNPTDMDLEARVTPGFPFSDARTLRLDEATESYPLRRDGRSLRFSVPPHALRTIGLD